MRWPGWRGMCNAGFASIVCLASVVSQANGSTPNARVLGASESVLHFCEAHDPSAAAKLRRRIEELVSGRTPTELRELRDSDEYRKTYEAVLQFAERNDPHDVAGFCQRDGTVEH